MLSGGRGTNLSASVTYNSSILNYKFGFKWGKSMFLYPDFGVEMSKGIQEVTDTLQVPSTEDDV